MDVRTHLKYARILTELLDTQWNILGIRFGLDPVFDLIPGAEILPSLLSLYLVWIAINLHLPNVKILAMIGRICFDFVLGAIPWLGTIFDLFYKANVKNLKVIEQFIGKEPLEGTIIE
jgi:hypothetical protein